MALRLFAGGQRLSLDPSRAIGKGGEADVYDLGGGRALKVFKGADHPDVAGDPALEAAARARLAEIQEKLPAFPRDLPPRVVVPAELATDTAGKIRGYVMRLVRDAWPFLDICRPGRLTSGPGSGDVTVVLRDLHATLASLHARGVVVGDVNDLNVLVEGASAHVIDADSFQFGRFPCRMYTEAFLDPLRCDAGVPRLEPVRAPGPGSDWYGFAVLLMKSLLFVEPYGGIHHPADPARRLSPAARVLQRVTVLHPDVRYPRPARHFRILPDDLLDHLDAVLVRDRRGPFPAPLLQALAFTRCTTCGLEHARHSCPVCVAIPAAVVSSVTVRGKVTATRLRRSRGGRLHAVATVGGRPAWIEERPGGLGREDGNVLLAGNVPPDAEVHLSAHGVAIVAGPALAWFPAGGAAPARLAVESGPGRAALTGSHLYWLHEGVLWRDGPYGPERVGEVLAGQTRIWTGARLGFGLSRAGELCVAFVFGDGARALYDRVPLPRLRGQLVEAHAAIADERIWFLATTREAGSDVHRLAVIGADGALLGELSSRQGDGSFLEHAAGGGAAGSALFVPGDEGILRVELDAGTPRVTRRFPDTEGFVHAGCRLFPGAGGILVADGPELSHLRIDP